MHSENYNPSRSLSVTRRFFYYTLFSVGSTAALLSAAEGIVRFTGMAPTIAHIETDELRLAHNARLGWQPRPHVFERNNHGFHDDDWDGPQMDAYRIVILGDSVADGKERWNETYRRAFPYLLEQKLNTTEKPVRVYNLSVDGYNTMQEVENFRLHGRKLKPHLVIVAYCLNDTLYVAGNALTALLRLEYYEDYKRNYMMNDLLEWSALYRVLFLNFFQEDLDDLDVGLDAARYQILYRDTVQPSLLELKRLSIEDKFKVLLVIFPNHTAHHPDDPFSYAEPLYPFMDAHRQIEERARKAELPTVDLLPVMRACRRELGPLAVDILHLNPAGHACVSDFLADYLLAHDLVPQSHAKRTFFQ